MISPRVYQKIRRSNAPYAHSLVEVYEFCNLMPKRKRVYVQRCVVDVNIYGMHVKVTTAAGHILGYGSLGRMYKCNKSRRYRIQFDAINGSKYRGVYYASAPTPYADVFLMK